MSWYGVFSVNDARIIDSTSPNEVAHVRPLYKSQVEEDAIYAREVLLSNRGVSDSEIRIRKFFKHY